MLIVWKIKFKNQQPKNLGIATEYSENSDQKSDTAEE